jgi:two-component system cell cycle sensor histidine kinase/response regulator CckA
MAQRNALVELAGLFHAGDGVATVFKSLTSIVASTLRVRRVSVWRYDGGRTLIDCLGLYDLKRDRHTRPVPLPRSACPAYFDILRTGDVIVADDARSDPRTREFTEPYLTPLGIVSMLDAPFRVAGEVEGVLCCEHTGRPRRWRHDEVTFVVAVAQVLSRLIEQLERTRVQAAVRLRSAALNAATDAVSIVDAHGDVVWANDAFASLMLSAGARAASSEPPTDAMRGSLRAVFGDGDVREGEVKRARSTGTYIGHQTISPITNASGAVDYAVVIERDLTHQRSLEAQLQQAQKMEAVGQLTGGIAHDFNNLLTIIGGHAQLLADGSVPQELAAQGLREIVHASTRAAALTRQLLAFSRQQQMTPEVLDLNAVLSDVGQLLSRAIGADVRLTMQLAPEGVVARVDRVQFEQVVMNIAVNARAAMPTGGTFHVTTDVVTGAEADAVRCDWPSAPSQDLVRIRLADSGCGMSDDIRARVFEPFFSTRTRDKGTGLGLSTAHGIVTQSGGHIQVESAVGAGSTFTIYLPRVGAVASPEALRADGARPGGHETILVVEDEPAVRALTVSLLRNAGYDVLEADRPSAARQLAASTTRTIDLLLTDVIMPEETGDVLYRALAAERAQLPVLFMSGYPRDRRLRELPVANGSFLAKPFTQSSLLTAVRESLSGVGV